MKAPLDSQKLQITLGAARDRKDHLDKIGHKSHQDRVARGQRFSSADRFTLWFSRHYMLVINILIFIYVGLPVLAPVLMKAGFETPAAVIYRIYGGMCHQLSYRSWFLFGEQPFYPRGVADIDGYETFHEATGLDEDGLLAARQFTGNVQMGFKTALCQRDLAG